MCETTAVYTTIAGPRHRVQWMMEQWEDLSLITGQRLADRGIGIRWYDLAQMLPEHPEYRDPLCGAVAVAYHPTGDAARAAASISSALSWPPGTGSPADWSASQATSSAVTGPERPVARGRLVRGPTL